MTGFEPVTFCTQNKRANKLRYIPFPNCCTSVLKELKGVKGTYSYYVLKTLRKAGEAKPPDLVRILKACCGCSEIAIFLTGSVSSCRRELSSS